MYVIWLYYLFVQSVVALAYYKWRQSQYVSKKEGLTMVKLEEKMMAIDPNWEQVLFEALGIFLLKQNGGCISILLVAITGSRYLKRQRSIFHPSIP